jgi:cytochrome c oxidase cbb3-type subunit 2
VTHICVTYGAIISKSARTIIQANFKYLKNYMDEMKKSFRLSKLLNEWLRVIRNIVLLFGGLVEIVPLFFQKSTTQPIEGVKPLTALQLAGRDVYVREGCYNCHSQMIRPFRAETLRYGPYSVAGESVYDHPFQWGSKRTGPDLARVGGRYSDEWHRIHLLNPRDVVPESNMPAYPWLGKSAVDAASMPAHMKALRTVGVPYTDAQIAASTDELKGKTEIEAVIAYLQGLGLARK